MGAAMCADSAPRRNRGLRIGRATKCPVRRARLSFSGASGSGGAGPITWRGAGQPIRPPKADAWSIRGF